MGSAVRLSTRTKTTISTTKPASGAMVRHVVQPHSGEKMSGTKRAASTPPRSAEPGMSMPCRTPRFVRCGHFAGLSPEGARCGAVAALGAEQIPAGEHGEGGDRHFDQEDPLPAEVGH